MAARETIFEARIADEFSLADAFADAGLALRLTRNQVALVFELVKPRLPAFVVLEQRTAKGTTSVIIANTSISRFTIDNRAKLIG